MFEKIQKLIKLFKSVDLAQLEKLSQKVDLAAVINSVSKMDERQLQMAMKMLTSQKKKKDPPPIDADFYAVEAKLSPADRELQLKVRAFLEAEIKPLVNKYWLHDEFPFEIIPKLAELNVCGYVYEGYGCAGGTSLMDGIIASEFGRVDPSIATFLGVQSGLAMGSIYLCGSEEQKAEWLPAMQQLKKIGAFGLTEPLVGSGTAGGLTTTSKREGDKWILNGQKKWIGNSTFSDMTVIWARDLDDQQVKGFIVRKENPGFSVEKI